MSNVLFSEANISKLKKNITLLKISKNANLHTTYFKRLFIKEYISSKQPRNILK